MSQYTNYNLINGYISDANLISLTDDDQSGQLNQDVLNNVIIAVSGTVDALLADIYQIPFNQVNVPPLIQEAATMMACFALCRRRLVPGESNPFNNENDYYTKKLRDIAEGKAGLDANTRRAFPPVIVNAHRSRLNESDYYWGF